MRVSLRRSLLLGAALGAATLAAAGHEGGSKGGVKIEKTVKTNGGIPDTVLIEHKEGDKAAGEPDTVQITIRECKAVAGRDGEADLAPVFESLRGCPTGLVTLLSPAQGGPAAYTWSQPSVASDIPTLLLHGSGATTKGKKDEVGVRDGHCVCGCVFVWSMSQPTTLLAIHVSCVHPARLPPRSRPM